jgi:hypothetical protein
MAFKHRAHGIFLAVWLPIMILVCLGAAGLLSPLQKWDVMGPLLLFLGLLTLINAPFDWVSLGLTRALLRRGLELGGWWPYILAVVDAILAAGIIALLALTMVIVVQAFDQLAAHGGSARHSSSRSAPGWHCSAPLRSGILVDLRAPTLHNDPELDQSHDRWCIAGARSAGTVVSTPSVHPSQ